VRVLHPIQDRVHRRHEQLALVVKGRVPTVLEDHELGTGDARVDVQELVLAYLVVATAHHKSGNRDLLQAVEDVPVANATRDGELARPVHRLVDDLAHFAKGQLQAGRPRPQTTEVALVEDGHGR